MDGYEHSRAKLFETMLEPHLERMFRLAFRLTHSRPEAEDLFQDVLVKVYSRIEELAGLDDPGPWLCKVLYNRFIDDRRRFQRRRLVDVSEGSLPDENIGSLPDNSARPDDIAADREALGRALDQLSDEHRSIVLLHDGEGYKLAEIEAMTGTPVGTIKSRLHRARARLREILEDGGTFSGPAA